jgi:hypothetical protein
MGGLRLLKRGEEITQKIAKQKASPKVLAGEAALFRAASQILIHRESWYVPFYRNNICCIDA